MRVLSRFRRSGRGVYRETMLMDAGGAQSREAQAGVRQAERIRSSIPDMMERLGRDLVEAGRKKPTREQLLERLRVKAVPELITVDDVHELHETHQPNSPVYRVNSELLGAIGIAGVLQANPNIEKTGVNEALGAHFDEYRHIGAEWTAWTSIVGVGTVRAAFLSDELFAEYREAAEGLSDGEFDQRLQKVRRDIGNKCINSRDTTTFTARYHQGDTFLLWHGSLEEGAANPGAHVFDRTDEGVYTIHAAARKLGEQIPEGFVRLT